MLLSNQAGNETAKLTTTASVHWSQAEGDRVTLHLHKLNVNYRTCVARSVTLVDVTVYARSDAVQRLTEVLAT